MMDDGRESAAFRAAVTGAMAAMRFRDSRSTSHDAGPWRLIERDTGVELFAADGLVYVPLPINVQPNSRDVVVQSVGSATEFQRLEVSELQSSWSRK